MYQGPFTIKQYKVSLGQNMLIVASHHGPVDYAMATIALECVDGHTMNIHFIEDGEDLQEPYFQDYGQSGGMFLKYAQFPHVLDILRNEKPLFAHFFVNHDGGGRIWLSTNAEPVGEGEGK